MTKTEIPIERNTSGFNSFINQQDNRRIFFSAPFGMGKTYFLEEFFGTREDSYDVFHLYPVKYQLRSDSEIMEVIGADLLAKVLKKEEYKDVAKELLEEDTEGWVKIAFRALPKFLGLLAITGIENFTIINTTISLLKNLDGVINKTKRALKNKENKNIKKKLKNIHNNFFEDVFSEILKKIKEKDGKKENVLILDDLDRLDPKHIFKILNAFSPLQDEEENKFGFDKVIFVGDIDNIQKIFHHIYGEDTDFNGYIDKFFSTEPYRYDMEKEIQESIKEVLLGYFHSKENPVKEQIESGNDHILYAITAVILPAVQDRKVNLRNMLTPQKIELPVTNITELRSREKNNAQVNITAKILVNLFQGDQSELISFIRGKRDGVGSEEISQVILENVNKLEKPVSCMIKELDNRGEIEENSEIYHNFLQNEEEVAADQVRRFRENCRHQPAEAYKKFLDILSAYIEQELHDI